MPLLGNTVSSALLFRQTLLLAWTPTSVYLQELTLSIQEPLCEYTLQALANPVRACDQNTH